MTLVALFSTMFITAGSFWSTWMATRWVLPSAASADEASAIDSAAAVARRRNMGNSLVCYFVIASEARVARVSQRVRPSRAGPMINSAIPGTPHIACARAGYLWSYQCIAVFGEKQYLPDADLHRCRSWDDLRPPAGLALDGVDGIEAHVETYALRNQAFDLLARRAVAAQDLNAGTERDHFDGDLVRIVEFQQVVGD